MSVHVATLGCTSRHTVATSAFGENVSTCTTTRRAGRLLPPVAASQPSVLNTSHALSARGVSGERLPAKVGFLPVLSARRGQATPRFRRAPHRPEITLLSGSNARSPLGLTGEALGGNCEIPPPVSRPDGYREEGVLQRVNQPLLPEYSLWVALQGGNGSWKQVEAEAIWEQQLREHEDWQRSWALREERLRAKRLEAERQRKEFAEEEIRRYEAAQRPLRQLEEEEARRRRIEEEERLRRLEEEERQRRLSQPRTCITCQGSGKCGHCEGMGSTTTVYLSASVTDRSHVGRMRQRGSLPKGCHVCGGDGDGSTWGEFVPGTGKCNDCLGAGTIPAPKDGWPDEE